MQYEVLNSFGRRLKIMSGYDKRHKLHFLATGLFKETGSIKFRPAFIYDQWVWMISDCLSFSFIYAFVQLQW